jgi:hypothetical protein
MEESGEATHPSAAHRAPVPAGCTRVVLGCCFGKKFDRRPHGLHQASPAGVNSKVGLEVMPIDKVII